MQENSLNCINKQYVNLVKGIIYINLIYSHIIVDIFIYGYLPLLMHHHLLFYLFSFVTQIFRNLFISIKVSKTH